MRIKSEIEQKANEMALTEYICALIGRLSAAAPSGASGDAAPPHVPTGRSYRPASWSTVDCHQVDATDVSEPSDADPGYDIRSRGGSIAPDDKCIRQSPDGGFHWCAHAGVDVGHTICLFAPPRGV